MVISHDVVVNATYACLLFSIVVDDVSSDAGTVVVSGGGGGVVVGRLCSCYCCGGGVHSFCLHLIFCIEDTFVKSGDQCSRIVNSRNPCPCYKEIKQMYKCW